MDVSANIPERTAIAIVGGGLAGWAVAEALGESARDAVLLDAGATLGAELDASLGIARAGSVLSFARLAAGHATPLAAACAAAGRRNRIRLEALAAQAPRLELGAGVVRFAAPDEADELRRSTALLRDWGYSVRDDAPASFALQPPARFVYAAANADDRIVDVRALIEALARRARAAGLRVAAPAHVARLEDEKEVLLTTRTGTLRAEIVVVATGAALPQLVPFCRFKIVGMRAQWLRAASPAALARHPQAWLAADGYELYRWHADGDVTLSGSRRLPVQRELGARPGTSPEVQELLEANWREIDSHGASTKTTDVPVQARGAAVQSVSCDGLPLAGPVPGHPRVLVAGGFGTNTPGLALAAGEVVAQLIQSGRAEHAAPFAPRRFL